MFLGLFIRMDKLLSASLCALKGEITAIIFTTLIGLASSFFIDKLAVLLFIVFWMIGFLYNWKLKEVGLLGNLLVASSVAITFILGGIAAKEPWNIAVWILSLIVFLFDLGEEIAADAMDIEGDKMRNVKSIAILIGKKNALRISTLLFVLVALFSFLPVFLNLLGTSYLIIISITDVMILFFGIKLLKSSTIAAGRLYIRAIYLSALFGMIAIIVSEIIISLVPHSKMF
ncbi:MAG: UbiA family prenyltransferase [Gorillibacterium sp.]|nr:UbiA family prenyltransferase [Gorillibacterium sp.]